MTKTVAIQYHNEFDGTFTRFEQWAVYEDHGFSTFELVIPGESARATVLRGSGVVLIPCVIKSRMGIDRAIIAKGNN